MDTRNLRIALALAALSLLADARAQTVIHADEDLSRYRPEAWAMNYVAASTLMTSFGATPPLAPGQWQAGGDLGHIPRLSDSQQQVGFIGTKQEDLNRSPVFGRIRAMVGLPAGFVLEGGYTPPLTIDGTQPRDVFALAVGKRVYERNDWSVSLRGFGQVGRVHGDITCPARLANLPVEENAYGCREPSDDRILLNLYGADATAAYRRGDWSFHGTLGAVRSDLEVQVDALVFENHDRSKLTASGSWPYLAAGASYDLDRCWKLAAEILYVPLKVQRDLDGPTERDPLTSLRLRAMYRF